MKVSTLTYQLPGASWRLQFSGAALRTLDTYVQRKHGSRESVGQLYSRDLTQDCILIEEATVLAPTWAAWARVQFDTRRAADERAKKFDSGLHCLGLWHTHPEPVPSPSSEDRSLAREHALAAGGQLMGLVFAIIGTRPLPVGLRVWVDDGAALQQTEPVPL